MKFAKASEEMSFEYVDDGRTTIYYQLTYELKMTKKKKKKKKKRLREHGLSFLPFGVSVLCLISSVIPFVHLMAGLGCDL